MDLTIAASDNPGGVFFFLTPSLSLSEDLVPSGVLQVQRDSQAVGLFGRVEVAWEALYIDGEIHPVSLDTILVNQRGTLVFAAGQTVPETELTLQLNPNSVCCTVSNDFLTSHSCYSCVVKIWDTHGLAMYMANYNERFSL